MFFCFPCARYLHPRIVEPHSKTIGHLNWCKKKDIDPNRVLDVTPINNKDFVHTKIGLTYLDKKRMTRPELDEDIFQIGGKGIMKHMHQDIHCTQ